MLETFSISSCGTYTIHFVAVSKLFKGLNNSHNFLPGMVWFYKELGLLFFYNISMPVVQSNCGSSFSGEGVLYTYPIYFYY